MSTDWQFTQGANTVSLPPPDTFETWEEKAQALGWTAAGEPRAYNKDVVLRRARLTWRGLASPDKESLTEFFHNASTDTPAGADGVMETFTLTDHEDNAYTARFAKPELRFAADTTANRWSLTTELVLSAVVET